MQTFEEQSKVMLKFTPAGIGCSPRCKGTPPKSPAATAVIYSASCIDTDKCKKMRGNLIQKNAIKNKSDPMVTTLIR
jgi:hypothetical protein